VRFEYTYRRASAVESGMGETAMSFSPDLKREPTYFRGRVARAIEFREAMSALHAVVVSDLRFKPKDRTAYREWLAGREEVDWMQVGRERAEVVAEIDRIRVELDELRARRSERWRPFEQAKRRYFEWLYQHDRDLWFVLDPVITVHPDEVAFECFSQDESSYGRLAASFEVFEQVGDKAYGTTNIDYSQALYDEFQKIRTYKTTTLDIDPRGFQVETSMEQAFKEVKIDLPDTWVRGFLQVSSAMTLPATSFDLHPMDVHNLCFVLRRRKELVGPRSLRFRVEPDRPVSVVVDPWGLEVRCPRSVYQGREAGEVRVWGRRRLLLLERLLPLARRFRVHLLGSGLPSFYVADLGHMTFTLGLSGWTHNDWAEAANFDLLAAREEVDELTAQRVWDALGETWLASAEELSRRLGLDRALVASALGGWVQAGRAIYDLDKGVYRKRELSREPLPMDALRFSSPREEKAIEILHTGKVAVQVRVVDGGQVLEGRIQHKGKLLTASLTLDADRRVVGAECSCDYYIHNRLFRGPCEHMLALRVAHRRGVSDMIDVPPAREPKGEARARPVAARPSAVGRPAAVASPDESAAAEKPPELTREVEERPGFFRRVWGALSGRGGRKPAGDDLEKRIDNVIEALAYHIVVSDRDALARDLVRACREEPHRNGWPFVVVALLKDSPHLTRYSGEDQTILRLVREAMDLD